MLGTSRIGEATTSPASPSPPQKILVIQDKPLLAILDAHDIGVPSPPPDPAAALKDSDAISRIYREDIPKTFDYMRDCVKAVHSSRSPRAAVQYKQVAVLALQGPRPERESDGTGRNYTRSIDATNFYRLSGVGTHIGLDAVLGNFLAPISNHPHPPPPPNSVPVTQSPPDNVVITRGGPMELGRPSCLSRMFSKSKGH